MRKGKRKSKGVRSRGLDTKGKSRFEKAEAKAHALTEAQKKDSEGKKKEAAGRSDPHASSNLDRGCTSLKKKKAESGPRPIGTSINVMKKL